MRNKKKQKYIKAWKKQAEGNKNKFHYEIISNPLYGIQEEDILESYAEFAEKSQEEFDKSLNEITALILKADILHTLTLFSLYSSFLNISDTGKVELLEDREHSSQPEIELLQALALTHHLNEFDLSAHPMNPTDTKIDTLLVSLRNSFSFKRLSQIKTLKSKEEKAIFELQEFIRLHTHYVRNWGFFKNVLNIIYKIHAPLDPLFLKATGVKATEIITFFSTTMSLLQSRINEIYSKLRIVFKRNSLNGMIIEYYTQFNDLAGDPKEFIRYLKSKNISMTQARDIIISHVIYRMDSIFLFKSTDIFPNDSTSNDTYLTILNIMSYRFGDLKD